MNLGLIGNGFVGNAIYQNLKREYDFIINLQGDVPFINHKHIFFVFVAGFLK